MNKYTEHDIDNGIRLLKIGIMNALKALNDEEIESFSFKAVSYEFLYKCMVESGWSGLSSLYIASPSEKVFQVLGTDPIIVKKRYDTRFT